MQKNKARYTAEEHAAAEQKILTALDELIKIAERYQDVIAIPEIITLHDITEYRINSVQGPVQFKTQHGKTAAEHVLQSFGAANYITPEKFEDTIVRALENYDQE
jgi:hypothetical protein